MTFLGLSCLQLSSHGEHESGHGSLDAVHGPLSIRVTTTVGLPIMAQQTKLRSPQFRGLQGMFQSAKEKMKKAP